METTMTLEKYKSMKKAKNVREEKKLKNIDIDALIKKKSKNLQVMYVVNLEIIIRTINMIMKKIFMSLDTKFKIFR